MKRDHNTGAISVNNIFIKFTFYFPDKLNQNDVQQNFRTKRYIKIIVYFIT